MIVIYVGLGLGQFLLNLADARTHLLFVLIAVLISLAVVPMALTAQRAPEFALPHRVSFRELLEISPLGTIGVFFSGAISATLFSLGPVYAARTGMSAAGIAVFMACSILPAVVLQLPLGRLSDRVDRRTVLIAMSMAAAAAAATAMLHGDDARVLFLAAVIAYGGLSLTTYALCVSHINDHLRPEQMVAASGSIILLNGVGAVFGPLIVAAAMQGTGVAAYFGSAIVVHMVFAALALWRKRRSSAVPSEDKARFVGAPPQVAPTGRLAAPEAKPPSL
jgi:MFS family permease